MFYPTCFSSGNQIIIKFSDFNDCLPPLLFLVQLFITKRLFFLNYPALINYFFMSANDSLTVKLYMDGIPGE